MLEIEYGAPLGVDHVFEPQPKRQSKVYAEPQSYRHK